MGDSALHVAWKNELCHPLPWIFGRIIAKGTEAIKVSFSKCYDHVWKTLHSPSRNFTAEISLAFVYIPGRQLKLLDRSKCLFGWVWVREGEEDRVTALHPREDWTQVWTWNGISLYSPQCGQDEPLVHCWLFDHEATQVIRAKRNFLKIIYNISLFLWQWWLYIIFGMKKSRAGNISTHKTFRRKLIYQN